MKSINKILILICIIFIAFALIVSILPDITLSTIVLLGCFAIPAVIVFISMYLQTKKATEATEKKQIRHFTCTW